MFKMSKLPFLKVYVTERLTAVAAEISVVFERTLVQMHEEISRSKEESDRLRRLLDSVFNQQITLQKAGEMEEEDAPEQQHCAQEGSPSWWQEHPEPPQIKVEQRELRTSQEEEQFQGCGEPDMINFILSSAHDQKNPSQPSHHEQLQTAEDQERDSLPTKTTEEFKTEPDVEEYRLPTIHYQLLSELPPDCSAAQSGKGADQRQTRGLPTGVKWTSKGESNNTSSESEMVIPLPCFTSANNSLDASYCCVVCGKTFVSSGFLICHVRKTHTEHEDCQCGVCGKHLDHSETIISHLQAHATENISCHVCGKYFSKNRYLKIHMRSHTGEKPYRCNQCRKCYTQKVHLNYHMRTHTGEKPFRCQECGKYFSQKNTLSNHMRIHRGEKPYQCKICGKCFTESGALIRHIRVHTGEKPHQCQECGKGFSERGNLSKHIKIHRRELL